MMAGFANILGVLVFSKLFTSKAIPFFDPVAMSTFGLVLIIVWGLAYIAVSKAHAQVKWLVAVFAVEKLVYVIHWIDWLTTNQLGKVYEADFLAGVFYSIYGVNDLIFMAFFAYVFLRAGEKHAP